MAGQKFDGEKERVDLVDGDAVLGLARVLAAAAKSKYEPDNWRSGLSFRRVLAALERHLIALKKGDDTDPEFGLSHIDHLGCCWMFLSNFMKHPELYEKFDDRWKGQNNNELR